MKSSILFAALLTGALSLAGCEQAETRDSDMSVETDQPGDDGTEDPKGGDELDYDEAEAKEVEAILAKAKSLGTPIKDGDKDLDKIARVRITVDKGWAFPFNGSYEFGADALTCAMLLGEGESFPSGVTCEDI